MNRFLCLLVAATLLAACSSTTLSGSWRDPDFRGQIRKVYIVGVAKQDINRRIFEDTFSRELQPFGVTGLTSYRDLPSSETIVKEDVARELKRNGADSILMARMVSLRTEQVVTPGYVSGYAPPAPYYRSWDSYYDRRFEAIYQPPTISEFQVATIEANLYEAATGRLIWSAQLETVVENNLEKLFSDFVKTVSKDLQKQGLI